MFSIASEYDNAAVTNWSATSLDCLTLAFTFSIIGSSSSTISTTLVGLK